MPKLSLTEVLVPDFARTLVPVLLALWLFAKWVYPNLSRALGGGAPLPVVVHLAPGAAATIPSGAEVYEVLSTADSIFLELVFHPEHVSADEPGNRMQRGLLEGPPRRYLQLRASSVHAIERLHPFKTAPPFGGASLGKGGERHP